MSIETEQQHRRTWEKPLPLNTFSVVSLTFISIELPIPVDISQSMILQPTYGLLPCRHHSRVAFINKRECGKNNCKCVLMNSPFLRSPIFCLILDVAFVWYCWLLWRLQFRQLMMYIDNYHQLSGWLIIIVIMTLHCCHNLSPSSIAYRLVRCYTNWIQLHFHAVSVLTKFYHFFK